MAEQELLGIDQDPAQVFDGGPQVFAGLEVPGRGGELGVGGSAAKGDEIEFLGDRIDRFAALCEQGDPAIVIVELAVDRWRRR